MEYENTIGFLIANGLLTEDDKFIICQEAVSLGIGVMFGAIGAAIESSAQERKHYLMAANDKCIKLFRIDVVTGGYLNDWIALPYEKTVKLKVSNFGKQIYIKTDDKDLSFHIATQYKFRGFLQKEKVIEFFKYLKAYSK